MIEQNHLVGNDQSSFLCSDVVIGGFSLGLVQDVGLGSATLGVCIPMQRNGMWDDFGPEKVFGHFFGY